MLPSGVYICYVAQQDLRTRYRHFDFDILNALHMNSDSSFPLVGFDNGLFIINEEAVRLLESSDNKIAVIGVAGLPQVQKNAFLNWISENSSCFENSSGSKGIRMWTSGKVQQLYQADGENYQVILLDTEDVMTNNAESGMGRSLKFFTLTVILSSCLLYLSEGNFDENALGNLSFIENLSKSIRISSDDDTESDVQNFSKIFPKFYWICQIFNAGKGDVVHSAKNLLEQCLSLGKGFDRNTFEKNRIRNMINSFFPEKEGDILVHMDENYGSRPFDELNSDMIQQLDRIKKNLFQNMKVKKINGHNLTCSTFAKFLVLAVNCLNNGHIPVINNLWKEVSVQESQAAIATTISFYRMKMDEEFSIQKLPREERDIRLIDESIRVLAIQKFKSKCLDPVCYDQIDSLIEHLSRQLNSYHDANMKASLRSSEGVILEMYESSIKPKLYPSEGKPLVYLTDKTALRNDWRSLTFLFNQVVKGPGKHVVMSEFIRETLIDVVYDLIAAAIKPYIGDVESLPIKAEREAREASFREEITVLEHQIEIMKTDKAELSSDKAMLQTQLSERDDELKRLRGMKDLYGSPNDMIGTIQALEDALNSQTSLCRLKEEVISKLQERLANDDQQLNAVMTELTACQLLLKNTDISLKDQLAAKDALLFKTIKDMEKKLADQEAEARLRESAMSLNSSEFMMYQKGQISDLETKVQEIRAAHSIEMTEYQRIIDQSAENIKNLTDRLTELEQRRVAGLMDMDAKFMSEIKMLQQLHDEAINAAEEVHKNQIDEVSLLLEETKDTLQHRDTSLTASKVECARLTSLVHVLETELADNKAQVVSLTSSLHHLTDTVTSKDSTTQSLLSDISRLTLGMDAEKRRATHLDEQLRDSEQKVAALKEEISFQNGRLRVLEAEANKRILQINDLEEAITSLGMTVAEQKTHVSDLEQQVRSRDAKIADLQDELLMKGQRVMELVISQDALSGEFERLQAKHHDLQLKYNSQSSELTVTLTSDQDRISGLSQDLAVLRDKYVALESDHTALTEENKHLKQTYGGMHDDYESQKREFDSQMKSQSTTVTTLADALFAKETEAKTLEGAVQELKSIVENLTKDKSVLESGMQEKALVISVLDSKISDLEQELLTAKSTIAENEKTISSLSDEKQTFYKEMQFIIGKATLAEETVKRQLEESRLEVEKKMAYVDSVLASMDQLRSEKDAQDEAMDDLMAALEDKNKEYLLLESVLASASEEIEAYKLQKADWSALETNFLSAIAEKDSTISGLQTDISVLQINLDDVSLKLSEANNFSGEAIRMKEDSKRTQEEAVVLHRLLNTAMTDKVCLQDEIDTLKECLQEAMLKNSVAEDAITDHKSTIQRQMDALAERYETITQLETTVQEIDDRFNKLRSVCDGLSATVKELEASVVSYRVSIKQITEEKTYAETQLQELETALVQRTDALKQTISEKNEEICSLKDKIDDLSGQLDSVKLELEVCKEEDVRRELEDKVQELTDLTAVYMKQRHRVADIEKEMSAQRATVEELHTTVRAKEAQIREAALQADKYKQLSKDAMDKQQSVDSEVVEKLSRKSIELKEANLEMDRLKSENEKYRQELLMAKNQVKDLEVAFQDTISKMMTVTSPPR